jgi:sugar O-acyltransferase (sialic acid O-acetyltransferase NeuD family)
VAPYVRSETFEVLVTDRHVLVIGAGGHGKVVVSTLLAAGRIVDAIVDDDESLQDSVILGVRVVGGSDCIPKYADLDAIIAIGSNMIRRLEAEKLNLNWTTAVHPSATVHPSVTLGLGTVVFAGAVVQPGSRIGEHTIINTAASVDHDCVIGDFVHIAPGVHLGGAVRIENGVFAGIGADVLPNRTVGQWAVLGAGSVAIRNVEPHTVAVGVPARRSPRLGPAALVTTEDCDSMFIGPRDQRWATLLDHVPHDFYHVPGYVGLCGQQDGAQPLAFYSRNGPASCLIPVLRSPVPEFLGAPSGWCDLYSPYGYPVPLCTTVEAGHLLAFLESFRSAADEIGACSILLRLHPLLDTWNPPPTSFSYCVKHGETIFINLTLTEEEIWGQTREGHRYEIRRLQKLGFTAVMDDWSRYADFRRFYRQTMVRLGANHAYFFTDQYFTDLKDILGDTLHLCCILSPDGRVVAGALFTAMDGIMEYHLSANDPQFQRLAPTKLTIHCARLWGKAQGHTALHLGGGLGGRKDKLFDFKAGFSTDRQSFRTFRIIVNERRYAALTLRAGLHLDPETALKADYFPPYHRQVSAAPMVGQGTSSLESNAVMH